VPEAPKTTVVETVVEADTVKCANMGATTKVATAETAAVATTAMREGRCWYRKQRRDRKSFKHLRNSGLSVSRFVGRGWSCRGFDHNHDNGRPTTMDAKPGRPALRPQGSVWGEAIR
jgi:hypothetical protein